MMFDWVITNPPVHPRVCGEHPVTTRSGTQYTGSSPRVRGTPNVDEPTPQGNRFIPACAGNTMIEYSSFSILSVHPRVCGEHFGSQMAAIAHVGSSPRVRGTHSMSGHKKVELRFIPACAGNTRRSQLSGRTGSVHPRVCGEHLGVSLLIAKNVGSSPRVRGTLHASSVA